MIDYDWRARNFDRRMAPPAVHFATLLAMGCGAGLGRCGAGPGARGGRVATYGHRGAPIATIAVPNGICGYGIMGRKYGPDPLRLAPGARLAGAARNKPSPCTGACLRVRGMRGKKGCLGRWTAGAFREQQLQQCGYFPALTRGAFRRTVTRCPARRYHYRVLAGSAQCAC